jgi:phenylpropionate dioxygenase-like ring-hydroxylating dioxygenase large terminal subunit
VADALMLENHWYIACRSGQLRARPLSRLMLGRPIALFRDAEGACGAVADRCPHRNMALSRGTCGPKGLRCAYHGWTFDREGGCSDIPAMHPEDFAAARAVKVRAYPVREKQGFVWAYIGEGEPDHEPPDFPMYEDPKARKWVMERTFAGSAFNCAENFLDVPHTVFVHNTLFRYDKREEIGFEVTSGPGWVQAEFLNEKPLDTLLGRLLFPRNGKMTHTDRFMLPYTTRVDYRFHEDRHVIIMSQCTPVDADTTRVFTYLSFRFGAIARLVELAFRPVANVILDQDVRVIAEHNRDLNRPMGTAFLYHPTDAIAREMQTLIRGGVPEGLPRRGRMLV